NCADGEHALDVGQDQFNRLAALLEFHALSRGRLAGFSSGCLGFGGAIRLTLCEDCNCTDLSGAAATTSVMSIIPSGRPSLSITGSSLIFPSALIPTASTIIEPCGTVQGRAVMTSRMDESIAASRRLSK